MKKRKVFWTFKREKLFLFEIQERIYPLVTTIRFPPVARLILAEA